MVGVIPKILLDLVESIGGTEATGKIRERAEIPLERVFRLSEVYEDAEWERLFEASCEFLKLPRSQAIKLYTEAFAKDALTRWPKWFEMSKNSREFLIRQPKIHNYFASGVQDPQARDAINDKFVLEEIDENTIVTHYQSPNNLCEMYELLAHWVINHYQDTATVTQRKCMKHGDEECEFYLHWERFKRSS